MIATGRIARTWVKDARIIASLILSGWVVVLLVMGATSGLFLPAMAVFAIAVWRDWPWGWLGAVLIAGLLGYFAFWILMSEWPSGFIDVVGVINLVAAVGLVGTAFIRFWPAIQRRRVAQIGLGLVVAVLIVWAAVRFVVPPMLGWPAVTCGPGTTRADCLFWEDHLRNWTTIDLFLPVTEVTIYAYGTCDAVSRIRYLGGFERPGSPGGLC
jgi:hypothetical protein